MKKNYLAPEVQVEPIVLEDRFLVESNLVNLDVNDILNEDLD